MCETKQVVEVHEITMRALLDLLAPVVMGTDDEYVRYLVRGCECFAPDSLPMVRVGDWLVVSGRVRFGGSFGQVMICSAHGTLDYALACAGASARYDRSHPSTFSVFEYEVWHVVDDAPVSEPDPEPQSLDGLPGDGYEVFLYTSGVDSVGEYVDDLAGSVCFDSYFDAKCFARHSMRQLRPFRDGQPDCFVYPFSVALVTRYVYDECRWVHLGEFRRGCSGRVTWYRFRGVM